MKNYTRNHTNNGDETLNPSELRELCIRENYFCCGSSEAYSKLFAMNKSGEEIEKLAAAIWINSDSEADPEKIEEQLRDINRWKISLERLIDTLDEAGYSSTEIEIITTAVETHKDAGTSYKII